MRADLAAPRAHRHQHRDVAVLLHHHHHQRDQNIQRGHQFDQPDGDHGHDPLHLQRAQQLPVLLQPGGGGVASARRPSRRPWRPRGARFRSSTLDLDRVDHVLERAASSAPPAARRRPSRRRYRRSRIRKSRPRGNGAMAGRGPQRRQFALRADHGDHAVEHACRCLPPGCEPRMMPGGSASRIAQAVQRARFQMAQRVADASSASDVDALQHAAFGLQRARMRNTGCRAPAPPPMTCGTCGAAPPCSRQFSMPFAGCFSSR